MSTIEDMSADYLRRMDAAAGSLQPERRAELLQEIHEHVDAAREAAGGDPVAMRNALDRLGDPVEIVAAAQDGPALVAVVAPRPGLGVEIAALLLLTLGSLVPFAGWIAGVVLLWSSRRWTTAEKYLATVVMPFGPAPALFAAGIALPSGSGPLTVIVLTTLVAFWVIAPIVVAVVLYRRARDRAAQESTDAATVSVRPSYRAA